MRHLKDIRRAGSDARAAGRPRTSCPSPLHDATRSAVRYREAWYAGWDVMDERLREKDHDCDDHRVPDPGSLGDRCAVCGDPL